MPGLGDRATVQGQDLPDAPPSLELVLAKGQASLGGNALWRGSKLAEIEISGGDGVISGSKTIQVEIKE